MKDSAELSSVLSGALVLSNPAFLLVLVLASGISALLSLTALVTFLFYVF